MKPQIQEAGQSPRQDSTMASTAASMNSPDKRLVSPTSCSLASPTSSSSNPQQQVQQPQRCNCRYHHSQGLGSPCNVRYAAKVGRKATERILARSNFFAEANVSDNVCIQNEAEVEEEALLDESVHSISNHIVRLEPDSLILGKLLGKGGFCVVYEAQLPARLVHHSVSHDQDDVSHNNLSQSHSNGSVDAKMNGKTDTSKNSTHHSTTHQPNDYCVKFLKPSVLPERKKFARGIADLAIEAHFLASLNHPNILKLRGVSQSFQLFQPSSPSFLSGLTYERGLEGGCFLLLDKLAMTLDHKINNTWKEAQLKWNSLLHRTIHDIRGTKRKLFKLERIHVALALAQAMEYLHQNNICYRDLKPDNIGFDIHDHLKLFDFGLAKELKDYKRHVDGTYQLTANTGSKRYMAPEVASRARYNLSVDVFSFGILFWEICSLEKPFDGFTELQHMNLVVQRGHRPRLDALKYWPMAIRHIISRCWHPVSNERPTFRQVVIALIQVQSDLSDSL